MKTEFESHDFKKAFNDSKGKDFVYPCAHAFLYLFENGKYPQELLKKTVIAECFQETQEKSFSDVDPESTLYKAMQTSLKGGDFLQTGNLKLNESDMSKLSKYINFYKQMYVDAFGTAS